MSKTTTVQWQLLLALQLDLLIITHQSIEGVTYMSHFDFEQRYSNVRECDPFYWHPLHLPEHCAQMFEDLIRSRVASQKPVRIVRRRPNKYNTFNPNYEDSEDNDSNQSDDYVHRKPHIDSDNSEDYSGSMSPFEELFYLLKRDVKKNPTAPHISMAPNIGPIAVYKQPISKKSKNLIKKMARAYVNAGYGGEDQDSYYSQIDIKYPPDSTDPNSDKNDNLNAKGLDVKAKNTRQF